ncbi:MAG: dipeptidase [Ectothiorhodospiraceae bacterium]|nr:dipeptidase [Ectothiorhodospiraceae bacterium]
MSVDRVRAHLEATYPAFLERLHAFLRLPSVSTDPAYARGMADARALLVERLTAAGFEHVRTIAAGGHPAVYADWLHAPGRPTLLVYGHYDVQPPDPLERWVSPPFEPTERDGRLHCRGASDDKGPLSLALEALGAFLAVEGAIPINVKLLIEGEEELGSATLEAICAAHRELLAADAVLSADGARWRADLATVNVGMRGNAGFELSVHTAGKDLHSGRYGGAVANALHVMAALVASLHHRDGKIAVAGFLDDVEAIDADTRAALAAIPFDADGFAAANGAVAAGEPGFGVLERLWLRPTIEVNGMWGGYTGPGSKTAIPCEAHAKLTMRLAPGQTPERAAAAVRRHLEAACPPGVTIAFAGERGGSSAYSVPPEHPLLTAVEHAVGRSAGRVPLRVRIGATLPLAVLAHRTLGLDTVMFSFSTADEDFHAPNEFIRLSALREGLSAWVDLLRAVGEQPVEAYARHRRAHDRTPPARAQ